MRLQTLLNANFIKLKMTETKRTSAIREITELLREDPRVQNFDKFYQEILNRERSESTCLGCDVALPHARTDHVKDMVLAVGLSREGIFFENCNQTVHLLFVIGTPKRMAAEYLRLVGTLARLLKQNDIREMLCAVQDETDFIRILAEAELKL